MAMRCIKKRLTMIMITTTTDIYNVVRVQNRCISLTRKEEESHDDISSWRERYVESKGVSVRNQRIFDSDQRIFAT